MTSEQEREIEKLNEGRLLRDAGQVLLPILSQMKARVLARIILSHREMHVHGTQNLLAYSAELSVLEELTSKITRNNNETARREEKFHANAD